MYQPKTGAPCGCRKGQERDNCPACEGTGQCIDFAAVRARGRAPRPPVPVTCEIVTGTYYQQGYYVNSDDGRELYSAGNCAADSTCIVDIDDVEALSLRALRSYCIKTTRSIAGERFARYGGVTRA